MKKKALGLEMHLFGRLYNIKMMMFDIERSLQEKIECLEK